MNCLRFVLPYVISYKAPRRRGSFYYNPLAREKQRAQATLADQFAGSGNMIEGPVTAHIIFTLQMPKSWPTRKRQEMDGQPCLKRIDVDNCTKFTFDSLKEVVIVDDCQIWDCHVSKIWGSTSSTKISITF